eukprot:g28904.t1
MLASLWVCTWRKAGSALSLAATAGKAPKLQRRGDFQAAELLQGDVGPYTDVYGCASTLLWLLLKRTRKGLPERSICSLLTHFREAGDGANVVLEHLEPLAKVCVWGMEEDTKDCKEFIDEGFTLSLDVFARPMVLSFSPGWWSPAEMSLLNDFRMAMDELLASPEQETADIASNAYNKLMFADANNFLPDADYDIKRDNQVQARLVAPPCGNLELYEERLQRCVGGHVHARQHTRPEAFAVEHEGAQEKFSASPAWLRSLSELARQDLEGDLQILRQKFGLSVAELSETRTCG